MEAETEAGIKNQKVPRKRARQPMGLVYETHQDQDVSYTSQVCYGALWIFLVFGNGLPFLILPHLCRSQPEIKKLVKYLAQPNKNRLALTTPPPSLTPMLQNKTKNILSKIIGCTINDKYFKLPARRPARRPNEVYILSGRVETSLTTHSI